MEALRIKIDRVTVRIQKDKGADGFSETVHREFKATQDAEAYAKRHKMPCIIEAYETGATMPTYTKYNWK